MIVQAFCGFATDWILLLVFFTSLSMSYCTFIFSIYLNIKNIPKHFLRWIMVLSQVELPQNYVLLNFCVHFI